MEISGLCGILHITQGCLNREVPVRSESCLICLRERARCRGDVLTSYFQTFRRRYNMHPFRIFKHSEVVVSLIR